VPSVFQHLDSGIDELLSASVLRLDEADPPHQQPQFLDEHVEAILVNQELKHYVLGAPFHAGVGIGACYAETATNTLPEDVLKATSVGQVPPPMRRHPQHQPGASVLCPTYSFEAPAAGIQLLDNCKSCDMGYHQLVQELRPFDLNICIDHLCSRFSKSIPLPHFDQITLNLQRFCFLSLFHKFAPI